mmetsp:Transcript_2390/g.5646  ORF Transcript_2390/g.5646 Transcript_2390/m.5646 type:complete len:205 (-) Transcript_2390:339-953(-)
MSSSAIGVPRCSSASMSSGTTGECGSNRPSSLNVSGGRSVGRGNLTLRRMKRLPLLNWLPLIGIPSPCTTTHEPGSVTWPFGDSTTTFRLSKCVITNLNPQRASRRRMSLSMVRCGPCRLNTLCLTSETTRMTSPVRAPGISSAFSLKTIFLPSSIPRSIRTSSTSFFFVTRPWASAMWRLRASFLVLPQYMSSRGTASLCITS